MFVFCFFIISRVLQLIILYITPSTITRKLDRIPLLLLEGMELTPTRHTFR